jgi:hypothetical protein
VERRKKAFAALANTDHAHGLSALRCLAAGWLDCLDHDFS